MKTLYVYRDWKSAYNQTTILKDSEGKIKATFQSSINQPKYGLSEINIRGKTYALNWDNVVLIKGRTIKKEKPC